MAARPHPWLVIEDAHVAVPQVLGHFAAHMRAGDYFMVEDSATKQDDLAAFHAAHEGTFRIDTGYTDFFGRNATSAVDSILVRV